METDMNQTLITAIRDMQTVSFSYHGEIRTVEPHCYGLDTKGHDALRAYQINKGWRMFHFSDIVGLSLDGEAFQNTRQGYSRGDKGMDQIYAQI